MAIKISQMAEAPSLDGSELLEVSKLSSTITITATTISALASDNSFNDSGSGFLDAGFAVGDQVNVTGFTGNTANNIFSGKIQSLTAGKMVIESPAGDAIVNDAAGESVTITKWETYRTTTQGVADLGGGDGGGGGLDGLTFTSDTGSTADSDPGDGHFKWNNGTQGSATVLYFDNQTLDGVSLASFYGGLPATGYLYLEQEDDDSKWQMWKWTAVVSGSGYYKFTVAFQAGNAIEDDKTVLVDFKPDANAGGGGGGVDTTADAYASRPAAGNAGNLFLPNDSFYIQRDNGSVWQSWGPIFKMTDPTIAAPTTWLNQGSASVSTSKGSVVLVGAGTGNSFNFQGRIKSAPSTPYTITACMLTTMPSKNFMGYALCFRQSSDGKIHACDVLTGAAVRSSKFTSATAFSAEYVAISAVVSSLIWLRITDDGANRICSFSKDGQNFLQIHSIGRTDFLTADQVGFGVVTQNAATPNFAPIVNLLSWEET